MLKKQDESAWMGAREMSSNIFASIFDVFCDEGNIIINLTVSTGEGHFTISRAQ
jgi:hypothetical protein